ncbi:MAG: nickel-responsive transcriptional regulator NikR [Candidatus Margulisiibacteriota bacterium]
MGVTMLKRFGVSISESLLQKLDQLTLEKGYANRSEAIRDLIREKSVEEEWDLEKPVIGTVTLVYNHHARELDEKLNNLQHLHYQEIISTMHIHLDMHNCLEVLVIKGLGKNVKKIADKLIATKGVKHGKLIMTTTGENIH